MAVFKCGNNCIRVGSVLVIGLVGVSLILSIYSTGTPGIEQYILKEKIARVEGEDIAITGTERDDAHTHTSTNYANATTEVTSIAVEIAKTRYSLPVTKDGKCVATGEEEIKLVYHYLGENNPFYPLLSNLNSVEGTNDSVFTVEAHDFSCQKTCHYTYDKSLQDSASLVLFQSFDLGRNKVVIPFERAPYQPWAVALLESPEHFDPVKILGENDNRFNWFMTYRSDSDVNFPYGYFYKRKTPLTEAEFVALTSEQVREKSKSVAWLVSNCYSTGGRQKIVDRLKKFIPIDVYGKCGKKCPTTENCRKEIAKDYKFYLAFENSLCLDYVTEKFFESFVQKMVPITFGVADYAKIAPPHSYINIFDFKNLKELANYIKRLEDDPKEYLKYFEWQKEWDVAVGKTAVRAGLCKACIKLYEDECKVPVAKNFSEWWNSDKKSTGIVKSSFYGSYNKSRSACVKINNNLFK